MRILLIILLSIVAAACTHVTTDVSPSQAYRPAGADNLWKITGHLDSTYHEGAASVTVQRLLNVYIDNTPVVKGLLSAMGTGELSGRYLDHAVDVVCTSERKTVNWIDVRCLVLVDNERAVTLTF